MSRPRPLFQFDPGWLYLLPGLAICLSAVMIPAQEDLRQMQRQRDQLRLEAQHAQMRLKAHSDFLRELDQDEPGLLKRLIATQLNLIPADEAPVLMVAAETAAVTDWIDQTVPLPPPVVEPAEQSRLQELTTGQNRLWLLAGAMMCLCLGLVLSPAGRRSARVEAAGPAGPAEPGSGNEPDSAVAAPSPEPCEIVVCTHSADELLPPRGDRQAAGAASGPAEDPASPEGDDHDRLVYPRSLFGRDF